MIVTISGDIGSGKSTCGKLLAKKLGCEYLSTGAIQRQLAEERGMTTLQLNLQAERETSIDDLIDGYTKSLNDQKRPYVVDSRLAWHFIPSSYKVYLLCDERIAAQRIFKDNQRKSDENLSRVSDLLEKIKDRRLSEKRRFLDKYGIDFSELSNYDQVINTSAFTPEFIVELIDDGLRFYCESRE